MLGTTARPDASAGSSGPLHLFGGGTTIVAVRIVRTIGAVILAVAVLLLGFTVYTAYEIVQAPSSHLHGLNSTLNITVLGPSASFTWSSQGYKVTFTDTSTDNGSKIVSWQWFFGDGTTFTGPTPPTHTFAATCPVCTVPVVLNVTDQAGDRSTAGANVTIQRVGTASGVSQSTSLQGKVPKVGGLLTEAPTAFELLLLMVLIGSSMARAGGRLMRREPETVAIPVRPRPQGE